MLGNQLKESASQEEETNFPEAIGIVVEVETDPFRLYLRA